MNKDLLPITDSCRIAISRCVKYADPQSKLTLTVHVRQHIHPMKERDEAGRLIFAHPAERTYLNHDQITEYFGASEEDLKLLSDYFCEYCIDTMEVDRLGRKMVLEGMVEDVEKAFSTTLTDIENTGGQSAISYAGCLYLPRNLQPLVLQVEGLSIETTVEVRRPTPKDLHTDPVPQNQAGYTPITMAQAYGFPEASGKGQCIAIIELGGTYKESDFKKYFSDNKLPEPKVSVVGSPGNQDSMLDNAEVTLDLEIIGSLVPNAHLVVYYASSVLQAMQMIVTDKVHKPKVISISWAGPESHYTSSRVAALNQVFYEASLLGMTVLAASGDHGAYNNLTFPNVSLPTSNALVLGCGGTILTLEGNTIDNEVVWNENRGSIGTGGGFSSLYQAPYYQAVAINKYPFPKYYTRGVPDVAADASTVDGYRVVFNGAETVIGGTSAATPLWAALIVRMNEILGYNLGFINHLLYELAGTAAFRPITSGNNQVYKASPYWNPCTGLGSPHGTALLLGITDSAKT